MGEGEELRIVPSMQNNGKIMVQKRCLDDDVFIDKTETKRIKTWERLRDAGCKPIMWEWERGLPDDARCRIKVVLECPFDSGVYDKELGLLFGSGTNGESRGKG